MNFLISDTFTDSLARLTGDEQKAVFLEIPRCGYPGTFPQPAHQLPRAEAAVTEAGMAYKILDEHVETASGHISISTMHLAKGLEFRAVVVLACDDEILPLQERIETVGDDSYLQEVYDTERHLLYVACTRARDHLLITATDPAYEFMDDLKTG